MENQNIFIVHPASDEQAIIIKAFLEAQKIRFEFSQDVLYSPEFLASVEESREQYKKGEFISIEKKDIKKILGLE